MILSEGEIANVINVMTNKVKVLGESGASNALTSTQVICLVSTNRKKKEEEKKEEVEVEERIKKEEEPNLSFIEEPCTRDSNVFGGRTNSS